MDKLGAKGLRLFESRAAEYIKDKGKVANLINIALRKGMNSESLKEVWERLQLTINVLRDWVSGEYKELPKRSLIILTAALLYFITPADLLPDFIPLSGYLDDMTVLGFVYSQISKDLDRYKAWKEAQQLSEEEQEISGNEEKAEGKTEEKIEGSEGKIEGSEGKIQVVGELKALGDPKGSEILADRGDQVEDFGKSGEVRGAQEMLISQGRFFNPHSI